MVNIDYPPRIKKVLGFNCVVANKLLDIGCGDGGLTLLLGGAYKAEDMYGVDVDKATLKIAQGWGIKATYCDLNKEKLPFDDGAFGLVFAGEIIEHILSTDKFLGEIYRVLQAGGHLIITTPNVASWHSRVHLLFGYQPYAMPVSVAHNGVGAFMARNRSQAQTLYKLSSATAKVYLQHIKFFTCRGLCELLKLNGFSIVGLRGSSVDTIVFGLPWSLRKCVGLAEKVFACFPSLASEVIVCARKVDGSN